MVSRGLGNTTIRSGARREAQSNLDRNEQEAYGALDSSLRREQESAFRGYSGDELAARDRIKAGELGTDAQMTSAELEAQRSLKSQGLAASGELGAGAINADIDAARRAEGSASQTGLAGLAADASGKQAISNLESAVGQQGLAGSIGALGQGASSQLGLLGAGAGAGANVTGAGLQAQQGAALQGAAAQQGVAQQGAAAGLGLSQGQIGAVQRLLGNQLTAQQQTALSGLGTQSQMAQNNAASADQLGLSGLNQQAAGNQALLGADRGMSELLQGRIAASDAAGLGQQGALAQNQVNALQAGGSQLTQQEGSIAAGGANAGYNNLSQSQNILANQRGNQLSALQAGGIGQTGTSQNAMDFKERRTDTVPSLQDMASLALGFGAAGGGVNGGGGGPIGGGGDQGGGGGGGGPQQPVGPQQPAGPQEPAKKIKPEDKFTLPNGDVVKFSDLPWAAQQSIRNGSSVLTPTEPAKPEKPEKPEKPAEPEKPGPDGHGDGERPEQPPTTPPGQPPTKPPTTPPGQPPTKPPTTPPGQPPKGTPEGSTPDGDGWWTSPPDENGDVVHTNPDGDGGYTDHKDGSITHYSDGVGYETTDIDGKTISKTDSDGNTTYYDPKTGEKTPDGGKEPAAPVPPGGGEKPGPEKPGPEKPGTSQPPGGGEQPVPPGSKGGPQKPGESDLAYEERLRIEGMWNPNDLEEGEVLGPDGRPMVQDASGNWIPTNEFTPAPPAPVPGQPQPGQGGGSPKPWYEGLEPGSPYPIGLPPQPRGNPYPNAPQAGYEPLTGATLGWSQNPWGAGEYAPFNQAQMEGGLSPTERGLVPVDANPTPTNADKLGSEWEDTGKGMDGGMPTTGQGPFPGQGGGVESDLWDWRGTFNPNAPDPRGQPLPIPTPEWVDMPRPDPTREPLEPGPSVPKQETGGGGISAPETPPPLETPPIFEAPAPKNIYDEVFGAGGMGGFGQGGGMGRSAGSEGGMQSTGDVRGFGQGGGGQGGAQTTGIVRGDEGGMGFSKQASPMQKLRDTLGMSDAELNRPENKAVRQKFEADKKRLTEGWEQTSTKNPGGYKTGYTTGWKAPTQQGGGQQQEPPMDNSSSQQGGGFVNPSSGGGRTGYVAGNTGVTGGAPGEWDGRRNPADFPSRQNPNQMVGGPGSTGPWNQSGQPQILSGRGGQGGGLASLSNQAGGMQMSQSMGGGMPMQVTPMAPGQQGGLQNLTNAAVSKKAPRRTLNQMYRQ